MHRKDIPEPIHDECQIHPFLSAVCHIQFTFCSFRFCRCAQEKAAAALGTALCADLARALEQDTVQAIEAQLREETGDSLN